MAWIESNEEIAEHRKTQTLAMQLSCSIPAAVGYVHLLWHYTLKVSWETGDLSPFPPQAIARACYWDGPAERFIDALQRAGFLDGLSVHDWTEYAYHIIYQRTYNRERRKKRTAVKQLYVQVKTPFIPTKPNLTNITTTTRAKSQRFTPPTAQEVTEYAASIDFSLNGQQFVDHYDARGWQFKTGQPMKSWKAAVRTWKHNRKETLDKQESPSWMAQ